MKKSNLQIVLNIIFILEIFVHYDWSRSMMDTDLTVFDSV